MDRRRLLGLLALAVLASIAGCSAAGSLSMEPANDAEALAGEASRAVSELDPAPRDGERSRRDIVTTAIRNGSTEVTADRPPFDADLPFAFEGAYYALDHRVVDTQQAWRVTIGIDYNGTDPDGRAIDVADLPAPDREALDGLLPQRHPPQNDGIDFGVGAIYTPEELNESALAGDSTYDVVVFEGERYPIQVESPEAVTLQTYRYDARPVAPNASAYASQLREAYAFELGELSPNERAIVSEAVDDGSYYAESDDDSAFRELSERIRSHGAITRGDTSGTWLVRFEGELYVLEMHFGGFVSS
jgi:predicted small lipoprotein YifL